MIADDFKMNKFFPWEIDFENKKISYNSKGSKAIYTVNELYSYLQNLFARPQNMKYQIPIMAISKTEYCLINGWTIDEKARKYLKEGTLKKDRPDLFRQE